MKAFQENFMKNLAAFEARIQIIEEA